MTTVLSIDRGLQNYNFLHQENFFLRIMLNLRQIYINFLVMFL